MPPSLRPTGSPRLATTLSQTQCRHASLLRRPKRPYTFTQLITLSDGSTFMHRTTSPTSVYTASKDMRNHMLWNPNSQKLLNVEDDEAGRLRAFRAKYGKAWDSEAVDDAEEAREGEDGLPQAQAEDSLLDLISGYSRAEAAKGDAAGEQGKPVSGTNKKGSK